MGKLDGKVAIITGGARGMGASEARLFVQEGAKVVFTDLLEESGESLAKEIGENAKFIKADISKLADWEKVVAETESTFGPVNILVNNAGIGGETALIEDLSEEGFRHIVNVNLIGTFLGMKTVIPSMKKAGKSGSIVNVSSTGGMGASPMFAGYCSTKFGQRGLTKVGALELAPFGIRVNSIHPGAVLTPLMTETEDLDFSVVEQATPMKRIAQPEEIAQLVLFLASDDSSYSTGSEFIADGGVLASLY